jgi:hypothetical protein
MKINYYQQIMKLSGVLWSSNDKIQYMLLPLTNKLLQFQLTRKLLNNTSRYVTL